MQAVLLIVQLVVCNDGRASWRFGESTTLDGKPG
jgi:hypothetical protein